MFNTTLLAKLQLNLSTSFWGMFRHHSRLLKHAAPTTARCCSSTSISSTATTMVSGQQIRMMRQFMCMRVLHGHCHMYHVSCIMRHNQLPSYIAGLIYPSDTYIGTLLCKTDCVMCIFVAPCSRLQQCCVHGLSAFFPGTQLHTLACAHLRWSSARALVQALLCTLEVCNHNTVSSTCQIEG